MTLTEWKLCYNITNDAMQALIEILQPVTSYTSDDPPRQSEAAVQADIKVRAAYAGCWLGRNNNGACVDDTGRQVRYGLANDSKKINAVFKSSDLIGMTPRVMMPEDIGKQYAIFTAVEVKDPEWKFTPGDKRAVAQLAFINHVRRFGGIAGFAPNVLQYDELIYGVKNI